MIDTAAPRVYNGFSRKAGRLGRNKPHPRSTHPRVSLENHVDFSALPSAPSTVDWASKVSTWPIYYNDQLGDCTCAAVGHQLQAWTAYANTELDVPDSAILGLYEAMGYVPGDQSTDNGAVIQDVLKYMTDTGIAGQKYELFAELQDFSDMDKVFQSLYLFGSVYLGINCPDSAMTQFQNGQTWTFVPGATVEGGHAIVLQKKSDQGLMDIVTWGALQGMDQSFWDNYVEEAWVVVTSDWLNDKTQQTPTGLDIKSLVADFKSVNK